MARTASVGGLSVLKLVCRFWEGCQAMSCMFGSKFIWGQMMSATKTYDFSLCHLIRCVPSWRHSWNNVIFSNWFFKTANNSFHSDELSAFETTQASIDECVQREWSAKLSHEQCLDLANLEGKISGSLSACIVCKKKSHEISSEISINEDTWHSGWFIQVPNRRKHRWKHWIPMIEKSLTLESITNLTSNINISKMIMWFNGYFRN